MPPFGGPSSAQVWKSRNVAKHGRSYPWLPATSCSTEGFSHKCSARLFAAALFGENLKMPQKDGCAGSKRPFGPLGDGKCQHCSATFGASRTATAQAEGGLKISAAWPEISALLLLESSHAKTSCGRRGTSRLNHSRTCFTGSDLTVMLPSLSTRSAPCAVNTAPIQFALSPVCPSGSPNGCPACLHFSAAFRKKSQVHLSVSSLL